MISPLWWHACENTIVACMGTEYISYLNLFEDFFLPGEPITFLNFHWWSGFLAGGMFSLLEKGCGTEVDSSAWSIAALHFKMAFVSNELM